MGYKSILVHLDNSETLNERVGVAVSLAQQHQAHLIGLAPSGQSRIPGDAYFEPATRLATALQEQRDEAAQLAVDQFNEVAKQAGLSSIEPRIVGNDPIRTLLQHARYSDLVVIGQTDFSRERPSMRAGFVEQIVLGAGKPVLLIPYAGVTQPVGRKVILCWDASREAARAVDAALPMLVAADEVEILIINTGGGDDNPDGPTSGQDLAQFLARHEVKAKVREMTTTIDVGNTVLSHAADIGADLIVMGGYGHSRLREWVMGGATRMVLDTMTVPVLMAH